MAKNRLLALAAMAVGATIVAGIALRADDAKRPPARDADFGGKIVVVNLRTAGSGPFHLEKVETRHIGDRAFLVGSWVGDGRRAGASGLVWVSVHEVASLEEFANRDQYRRIYPPQGG